VPREEEHDPRKGGRHPFERTKTAPVEEEDGQQGGGRQSPGRKTPPGRRKMAPGDQEDGPQGGVSWPLEWRKMLLRKGRHSPGRRKTAPREKDTPGRRWMAPRQKDAPGEEEDGYRVGGR
jgi:hypothetical protein